MEIKQLNTFSVVSRTGSFSAAAKILGYAQPTVTTHIQLLEKEFDTKLFERLGHTIKLTSQGEQLLSYSEEILKVSSEAIAALSSHDSVGGTITIGANESFSVARLPAVFKHFLNCYPDVEICLKFGSVSEIHEQLQNNEVDVAFFLTREVSFPDLVTETLLCEQVVAAASPEHPFSAKEHVKVEDFENQVLILTQKNCTFRGMIDKLVQQSGITLHSMIEINNIEAIKQLVASGLGVTIMPRISIINEIAHGQLTQIGWEGPQLPVCTQIAYHKDKWLSPTLLKFLEETKSIFS